jgi:hypothetical protein
MKVVIIEDEYYTSEDLKLILSEIDPGITVLDVLRSVEDAIVFFDNNFDIL